jgi:hypothetical protein
VAAKIDEQVFQFPSFVFAFYAAVTRVLKTGSIHFLTIKRKKSISTAHRFETSKTGTIVKIIEMPALHASNRLEHANQFRQAVFGDCSTFSLSSSPCICRSLCFFVSSISSQNLKKINGSVCFPDFS